MSNITRRYFIKGLAIAPFALAVAPRTLANTFTRPSIQSESGQRMLEVYANAVRIMQTYPDSSHLSWRWWWYTHFVDGATNKAAEITRIFGSTTSTMRTRATECWNTCQSHAGQNANFFLPWHRMYTFYAERVVRRVTGVVDFAMPYWDYTAADPALRGVVPAQFRLPDDPVYGVLYRPNRVLRANTGVAIHEGQPGDLMNIDEIMRKTTYQTVGSVQGFCRALDSGIHGKVHTLVGNALGMGAVPYAGNDPLFLVHHCNTDRMWASWNRNGGKNPTDATLYPWVNQVFAMLRDDGRRVALRMNQLYSVLSMGYSYDSFIPAPPPPPTGPAPAVTTAAATTTSTMLKAVDNAQKVATSSTIADLQNGAATIKLLKLSGVKSRDVIGLDDDTRRSLLVLRKLHTWKQPGVLYHVYLSATPNVNPDSSLYVGAINFFDAEFHDHGGGSKLDDALGENFFSFDVTTVLLRIAKAVHPRSTREILFVHIVPGGVPEKGAKPMVAQVELVRQ